MSFAASMTKSLASSIDSTDVDLNLIPSSLLNTFVLSVVVYFLKDFATTVKEMKREFEAHRLEIARNYATQADLDDAIQRHEQILHHDITFPGVGK